MELFKDGLKRWWRGGEMRLQKWRNSSGAIWLQLECLDREPCSCLSSWTASLLFPVALVWRWEASILILQDESHIAPCLFSGCAWIPDSFYLLSLLLKIGIYGGIQRSQLQHCSPCAIHSTMSLKDTVPAPNILSGIFERGKGSIEKRCDLSHFAQHFWDKTQHY